VKTGVSLRRRNKRETFATPWRNHVGLRLKFKKLDPAAIIPSYARPGDAGMDVTCIRRTEVVPGGVTMVKTGLAVAVPPGHELQVRPKSGLAAKFGITVINTPGTIDSGYRGEIGVIMTTITPHVFEPGEKIAQLVLKEYVEAEPVEVDELDDTVRGAGGFGSTGA
jgi:dUTP pyrophosphatase